jgi:hypothetical protein
MRFYLRGKEVDFANIHYVGETFIIVHLNGEMGIFERTRINEKELLRVLKSQHLRPSEKKTHEGITYLTVEDVNEGFDSEEDVGLHRGPRRTERVQDSLSRFLDRFRYREVETTRIS